MDGEIVETWPFQPDYEVKPEQEASRLAYKIQNRLLLDPNYKLDLEEAKILVFNMVESSISESAYFYDEEQPDYGQPPKINFAALGIDLGKAAEKIAEFPKPTYEMYRAAYERYYHKFEPYSKEQEEKYRQHPKRFLRRIREYMSDWDEGIIFGNIAGAAIKKMPEDDRNQLSIFLSQHIVDFEPRLAWPEEQATYVSLMLGNLDPQGQIGQRVASGIIDFVSNVANRDKDDPDKSYLIDEILDWDHEKFLLKAIIASGIKENIDEFVGALISVHGMSKILNEVTREIEGTNPQSAYAIYEYLLGRPVNSPDFEGKNGNRTTKLHQDITEFYKSLNFVSDQGIKEEGSEFQGYPITEKAKGPRPIEYKEILARYHIKPGDKFVDMACGESWLAGAMSEMGYQAEGIDIDPKAIKKASGEFPKAKYTQADITQLGQVYPKDSVAALALEGGTGRHIPNWKFFMDQCNYVLVEGGVFIMDLPNPEKGNQGWRLGNYRSYLERFGFNRDWLNQYMWTMVGAPPGQKGEVEHFIDSTIYSQEWMQMFAGMSGLKLAETSTAENYDGRDSDKITYVFTKPSQAEAEEIKKNAWDKFYKLVANQPHNPNHVRFH